MLQLLEHKFSLMGLNVHFSMAAGMYLGVNVQQ